MVATCAKVGLLSKPVVIQKMISRYFMASPPPVVLLLTARRVRTTIKRWIIYRSAKIFAEFRTRSNYGNVCQSVDYIL